MRIFIHLSEPLDTDVNIWEEPVEGHILWSEKTDSDNSKIIHAASLNKLVENLTSEANPSTIEQPNTTPPSHFLTSCPSDMLVLKTFLMTYTTFTTAEKLLHKLIERYIRYRYSPKG